MLLLMMWLVPNSYTLPQLHLYTFAGAAAAAAAAAVVVVVVVVAVVVEIHDMFLICQE